MSVIPHEIPDFGSAQLAPRQNPTFAPGASFTSEDYFVFSRVDGRTSLRDIILMVGLGIDRTIAILRRLRQNGAVLLPGETKPPEFARGSAPQAVVPLAIADELSSRIELPPLDLGSLSPDEERAMTEPVQLQDLEKRRIIQLMRLVRRGDYFAVLGVARDVENRELKRAYFRVSKEFHPDRYFKRTIGSFGPWLSRIFETASLAFDVLSDEEQRANHVAELGTTSGMTPIPSQKKARLAADLFQQACVIEASGSPRSALPLFVQAIENDPQPRYLRRAATCALACGDLAEAERYAVKASVLRASDASYARVLADVYRAVGKLDDAEQVLVRAIDLPRTSDHLARELEHDLAALRAARPARRAQPSRSEGE